MTSIIRDAALVARMSTEAVRARKGKPINLDAYFATPHDVRTAFSMSKRVELERSPLVQFAVRVSRPLDSTSE